MYYIIDLTKNTTHAFEDKLNLLYGWKKLTYPRVWPTSLAPFNFKELNVTGKDSYPAEIPTGEYTYSEDLGFYICVYKTIQKMKTFQVRDDDGRSLDIRLWKDEIALIDDGWTPQHHGFRLDEGKFREGPWPHTGKPHAHCCSGPAMWHRFVQETTRNHQDELEDYRPVQDKTKVRTRGLNLDSSWNIFDRKYFKKHSLSWKDQSKAAHQWARHKKGVTKRHLRNAKRWKPQSMHETDYLDVVMQSIDLSAYLEEENEFYHRAS